MSAYIRKTRGESRHARNAMQFHPYKWAQHKARGVYFRGILISKIYERKT